MLHLREAVPRLQARGIPGYWARGGDDVCVKPLAADFIEEISNLLKRKTHASLSRTDELSIAFDYEGEVSA
jgi:hypothetical protein